VNEYDNIFRLKDFVSQMQQLAFPVRLFAKPSGVSQAKEPPRRLFTNGRSFGQFSVIRREPSLGMVSDRPEPQKNDDDQQNVPVSPAKPFVRANAMTLRTTVGSIIDLRATGRAFHSWSSLNA
jgi:hypothetical protein